MTKSLSAALLCLAVAASAQAPELDASAAADSVRAMRALKTSAAAAAPAAAGGVGDYSEGWRMGMLSKFSVKGWVTKSGEGELLMGADSSVAYEGTGDGRKMVNPWEFSCDPSKESSVVPLRGQYVVVKYRQYMLNNPLKRDTDYELLEISPVDKVSKPSSACENGGARGSDSKGFRVARIVKASYKGTVNKSYEIKVQMGGSGNEFYDMSVSDPAMFDCAVKWLKSGGKATVFYKQSFLFNPLNRNTGYDIVRIEPLPSLD
ncbi:MAG: hypothetical protein HY079_07965 [Elusimicrobia bacterium]|nr:hypothetical protein [Elusimicrobiota bacterium]